jgi:hypothetical protein
VSEIVLLVPVVETASAVVEDGMEEGFALFPGELVVADGQLDDLGIPAVPIQTRGADAGVFGEGLQQGVIEIALPVSQRRQVDPPDAPAAFEREEGGDELHIPAQGAGADPESFGLLQPNRFRAVEAV